MEESIRIPQTSPRHPPKAESKAAETLASCEDVFIFHDSLFRDITNGVMRNERLTVKKAFTPTIEHAYREIAGLTAKPSAIVLHTSTNDLRNREVDDIVKSVIDIYEMVNHREIKFIWSAIVPRGDNVEIGAKAELVNALVGVKLAGKDGAFICRNENFYENGMINSSLFDNGANSPIT